MSNYLAALTAVIAAGGVPAAESPPAKVSAAPAGTNLAATPAPHYRQGPGSTLTFTFEQTGAMNQGSFRQFTTELAYDEKNLAASSLNVKVQIASLDTQDKDRDATLASTELFDTQKFPVATFVANSLARDAKGVITANGKLTLRGVTHDLQIPLVIKPTAAGLDLMGEATIKRLDYGVGQGEWQSTEGVGDSVKLKYKVTMLR